MVSTRIMLSRFDFSAAVVCVRFERHSCVVCNTNDCGSGSVWQGSVVQCDTRVDAVFTIVWC